MTTLAKDFILSLSIPERIQLVEDIWDTILEGSDGIGLSIEKKAELNHRLDAYRQNPDEGSSWEDVKDRIKVLQ